MSIEHRTSGHATWTTCEALRTKWTQRTGAARPPNKSPVEKTISDLIVGPPKNIRDPRLFHSLSLVAFLAWVGLGSDGLSSSCYGPEEAFLALGPHQYLAVFLALMTAITVFVIAASYSQTIDLFPSGGGGYLVATTLLGPYPGLVSGSALVVDYVLTISISIASGADAIFSFLPTPWLHWKLIVCLFVVLVMIAMNLRGAKESVMSAAADLSRLRGDAHVADRLRAAEPRRGTSRWCCIRRSRRRMAMRTRSVGSR